MKNKKHYSESEATNRINADVEAMIENWIKNGERLHDVAPALGRASLLLFIGHGFSPAFVTEFFGLAAENQAETLRAASIQEKHEGADMNKSSQWVDCDEFMQAGHDVSEN